MPFPAGGFNNGIADISSFARLLVNDTYDFRVFDFKFNLVADFSEYNMNGFAFSGDGGVLYAFDDKNNQVLGFDTGNWGVTHVYELDLLLGGQADSVKTLTDLDTDGFLVFELGKGKKGFALLDLDDPSGSRVGTDQDDMLIGTARGELFDGLGGMMC